jgi:hypothetical protein
MGKFGPPDVVGGLLAALSGVIVALFTHYLSLRREADAGRRLRANTRALLEMEVRSNRTALGDFWRTINALGAKSPPADGTPIPADSVEHLADIYANGLISYTLPAWSTVRWEALEPRTVASLHSGEVYALDAMYRALADISDLYGRVTKLTAEDLAELGKNAGGRFWHLDLARERQPLFARLSAAVARALDAPDPLSAAK